MRTLVKQLRDDATLRASFNALAVQVFDLSFQPWFENGDWTEKYIPYAWAENGRVLANASVNVVDVLYDGRPHRLVQIGTVMTDPAFRGQGLSRSLIEEIIKDWQSQCEAIYLYANATVLDFYPKFGFRRFHEYRYQLSCPQPIAGDFRQIDMDSESDRLLLRRLYSQANPFSRLCTADGWGLLMFYCRQFLKDCVYYSPSLGAICIAEWEEEHMLCYDIFGQTSASLPSVLAALAQPQTRQITLGFTPNILLREYDGTFARIDPAEDDTTPFVLCSQALPGAKQMLPLLSHA